MALNVHAEKDGLIDGMPRDKRGNWQPEEGTKVGVGNASG